MRTPLRRHHAWFALMAIGAAALVAVPALARLWVDARWYEALGHTDVLFTPLKAQALLGLGAALAVLAWTVANLALASRLSARTTTPLVIGEGDHQLELDVGQLLPRLTWPVGLLLAILVGLVASGHADDWLLFEHGQPFGVTDPLFGRDVGFYVFTLPFLEDVFGILLTTVALTLMITFGFYIARTEVTLVGGRPSARRPVALHLAGLLATLFLVLAFGAWLSSAEVAFTQDGLFAGAGYADVHARLPLIRAHAAVAVLGAALVVASALRRRLSYTFVAVGIYLVVGTLGRGLYPAAVQNYVVEPNELELERPYIERVIAATRAAYGIDATQTRELSGDLDLTRADIDANRATLDNVRLWDHQPLLDTFGQIQEIRTYYDFASVDNDRYVIDGELRQTMLSPRELSTESLPNRTWINEHFTFTHGYGLALGPVNQADDEGLPRLLIRDIPPVSTAVGGGSALEVTRPQIYFGELGSSYVFVGTSTPEFDHPSGEGNVFERYHGEGGVEIGSHLFRAALALYVSNFKVLLSDDLSSESRVLLHRRVTERVRRLAPFLTLDGDPYMVVREDGGLSWIVDAYTETDRYPYSQRLEQRDLSYIRNAVKVVVDAYTGHVDLYINDEADPILRTWRAIFPDLFRPRSEMPRDLAAHLRYPSDIFDIQARMLSTFHMDSAELLYNREDQWEVPTLRHNGTTSAMEPYYTVMRLPGESEAEFIQMLPFTPARKDNLAAWMVARSDGEHLGELMVYQFPNDRLVYGPQQVLNRINQDAHISQQLSLWDQRGSRADFGTLLVIPIEESLIYVLPLYLRSEGGRIPQLKRVIVVHDDRIAMGENLDEAIDAVFRAAPTSDATPALDPVAVAAPPVEAPGVVTSEVGEPSAARALRHYERALDAQRRGDWAGYGAELAQLEAVLRAMQPVSADPTPTPP